MPQLPCEGGNELNCSVSNKERVNIVTMTGFNNLKSQQRQTALTQVRTMKRLLLWWNCVKGHHMVWAVSRDCLSLQALVWIKPDTLLLRQPKGLTYWLSRKEATENRGSHMFEKHLLLRNRAQMHHDCMWSRVTHDVFPWKSNKQDRLR